MTNPENREPSGFNQTVTVQVGAERRSFQAYVPLPLPPPGLDISPLAYREFDDNFLALAALAAASPDHGYAASSLARASEAAASCNIENISVTDDLAVRSALRTAFGPASGGTSAGGGTGRLMPQPGTYQTRVSGYAGLDRSAGDAVLAAYGKLYGRVQRKLFAEVAAGRPATSLKGPYLERYGIPARMFNAVRVSLDSKVSAMRAAQRLQQGSLQRRIAQAERQVAKAGEQGRWQQVHQKQRRLARAC